MRKALKAIILTCATLLVVMFVLSLLGIISNYHGNSFGFSDKTTYTSFILALLLSYVVVTDGVFTWTGELGVIILDAYMLWLRSKTAFVLITVLIVVLMLRHYIREGGIPYQDKKSYGAISYIFFVIYQPIKLLALLCARFKGIKKPVLSLMRFSFLICAVINYCLIFTYRLSRPLWTAVPIIKTFGDRLRFSILAFEEFPVTLFGTDVYYSGSYGHKYSSLYFIIDSAYVKTLLMQGVIPTIAILIGLTALLCWVYKKGYNVILLAVSLFAVDLVMDYSVAGLLFIVILIPVVIMFTDRPTNKEYGKLNIKRLRSGQRWGMAIVSVAAVIVLSVWCVTAYKITNRIDHSPCYGATLVVPRTVLGAEEDLLDEAYQYLSSHGDAFCIVDCEEDRSVLISNGIDENRVFVQDFIDIDDMLTSSNELIDANDMPNRLTICSYNSQIERISRHAGRLNIAVNSLSVKPQTGYLSVFIAEQWRLICDV